VRGGTVARVSFVDVSKRYAGGQEAIAELNLAIADGELVVLVGPSGSGKSTALRLIAGLEGISSGEVWIGNRVVNDVAPGDRDVAMVFQNYALYPHKRSSASRRRF
jgi:ABC-type sugar transport system ATPase subunit